MAEAFQQQIGAVMIENPDRVAWYRSLIEEWTAQAPHTDILGNIVAAWVGGYCSQAGVEHLAPTQVWDTTVESALEALANTVYAQLQDDIAQLQAVAAQWAIGVRL